MTPRHDAPPHFFVPSSTPAQLCYAMNLSSLALGTEGAQGRPYCGYSLYKDPDRYS